MRYTEVKNLNTKEFRRATGVKRETFTVMLAVLKEAHEKKKSRGGRPNKITVEDILMITLCYLREYRTYFHIGTSFGISESYAWKLSRWAEDVLVKCGKFSLPGKKELLKENNDLSIVLIDATESPVERPKRGKRNTIQVKRNVTH